MKKIKQASEREKFINRLAAYDEKFQKLIKDMKDQLVKVNGFIEK